VNTIRDAMRLYASALDLLHLKNHRCSNGPTTRPTSGLTTPAPPDMIRGFGESSYLLLCYHCLTRV
jgi:hypothetical protein